MKIRTHTDEEKRNAWRTSAIGLVCSVVFAVPLLILGFPEDLWTPQGAGQFLRTFLSAGLIGATAAVLFGPWVWLEDRDVRSHEGPGPVMYPPCMVLGLYCSFGMLGAVILVFRYLYLIIFG